MNKNITLITGGSGEIGKECIKNFLSKNNIIINLDLIPISDETINTNPNYHFIKVDVTNVEDINKAKEWINHKYSYLNNIISMAGINRKNEVYGLKKMSIEDIDCSIKLNLNSHIYITKIFYNLLLNSPNQNERTITIISSINAMRSLGLHAYSAGKAGIYGFVRSIAKELGKDFIRINAISLGTVPHSNDKINENPYFINYKKNLAISKFVMPKDVSDTILALIYQQKCITGQNIVLDNGQSL